jgi:hypothetical protein
LYSHQRRDAAEPAGETPALRALTRCAMRSCRSAHTAASFPPPHRVIPTHKTALSP